MSPSPQEIPANIRLTDLNVGERALVVQVDEKLEMRLLGFGLFPGVGIEVRQTFPACIICCEDTEVALEKDVASRIIVRKVE